MKTGHFYFGLTICLYLLIIYSILGKIQDLHSRRVIHVRDFRRARLKCCLIKYLFLVDRTVISKRGWSLLLSARDRIGITTLFSAVARILSGAYFSFNASCSLRRLMKSWPANCLSTIRHIIMLRRCWRMELWALTPPTSRSKAEYLWIYWNVL